MTVVPQLARAPYSRLPIKTMEDVSRELGRIQQSQQGVMVPTVLVHARSPYAVKASDWLLLCDCTAGAIALTFQDASRIDGAPVMVVKTDASANAVTLTGTFNGVVNPTLGVRYQSKTINAGNGAYYFVPTLTAADILSGTFPGNYVIAGTLEVDGNFSVNTSKFTVVASSGNTVVAGTLDATGNFNVNTSKFSVVAASGNTTVAGTLGVTGNFAVNTSKFTVTASSGNTAVAGTLNVTGAVTVASAVFVSGGNNFFTTSAGGYWASGNGAFAVGWYNNSGVLTFRTNTSDRFTIDSSGNMILVADTFLARRGAAMTNGAAAASGTLTNAPAAGNPTKWLAVDDNGTTRYVPSW